MNQPGMDGLRDIAQLIIREFRVLYSLSVKRFLNLVSQAGLRRCFLIQERQVNTVSLIYPEVAGI